MLSVGFSFYVVRTINWGNIFLCRMQNVPRSSYMKSGMVGKVNCKSHFLENKLVAFGEKTNKFNCSLKHKVSFLNPIIFWSILQKVIWYRDKELGTALRGFEPQRLYNTLHKNKLRHHIHWHVFAFKKTIQ